MYSYIYDEFVQSPKFKKELDTIESRLTDLGMSGKVVRLALFRDPSDIIAGEVSRGLSTVVAVGNDETARRVLDVVAEYPGTTFGYIPLGTPTHLARLLGIPDGVEACDVLSGRIVETIDMGVVNGKRFLAGIASAKFDARITVSGFRMRATSPGSLQVRNLAVGFVPSPELVADPRDGKLEAVLEVEERRGWNPFRKRRSGRSVLPFTHMEIDGDAPVTIVADGEEMTSDHFDISVEPKMLKVITGRGRMF
ncbi:hypothetical protein A2856_00285 [Candidatus Uhrbacteria bacterium RIFCSPHIGHO2_01_FULL_63_20]|uniref:DAGKc domain-containing protein n=1 Tax=Candidatus Uhrbacteria bacterium RIFCSPHIGHO2_01_FULL_63_20 TaxID=1802385 RepID=A0A1F7TLT3_9BACT|nr:MAG: hypothetical protein A2856_00285 [Candidatus Uhrbacteria bacterium RIFCSPHIGHO2_01_FULL_63_20]